MSSIAARLGEPGLFENYDLGTFYDEMFSAPDVPRPHYANEAERLTGKVLESLRYDKIEDIFGRGLHSQMRAC